MDQLVLTQVKVLQQNITFDNDTNTQNLWNILLTLEVTTGQLGLADQCGNIPGPFLSSIRVTTYCYYLFPYLATQVGNEGTCENGI